ncbi:hypothetical protein C4552_00605 [Candidatus Parcubacteria bacterium]|nr:MAG: hypothetical protein C4552_00605 [Candidatus Parcubacteria bacterium]
MRHAIGILCAVLAVFLGPTASFAEQGKPFYISLDRSVRIKEDLIKKIESQSFRVPPAVLADRIGKAAGIPLGHPKQLIAFLQSGEVRIVRCDWPANNSSVAIEYIRPATVSASKPGERRLFSFGTFQRPCYEGERVLAYRGRAFISLMCGNPIIDRRAPPVVSRVEPPVVSRAEPPAVAQVPPPLAPPTPPPVFRPCAPASVTTIRPSGGAFATGVWNAATGVMAGASLANGFLKEETTSCQ